MKLYHYSPKTGEYIGESEARPDPLEPGRFLIPALCTEFPPIQPSPGKVAVFREGFWEEGIKVEEAIETGEEAEKIEQKLKARANARERLTAMDVDIEKTKTIGELKNMVKDLVKQVKTLTE
jgi:hypothetical protein